MQKPQVKPTIQQSDLILFQKAGAWTRSRKASKFSFAWCNLAANKSHKSEKEMNVLVVRTTAVALVPPETVEEKLQSKIQND